MMRIDDPEKLGIDIELLPVRTRRRKQYLPYELARYVVNAMAPHLESGNQYRRWIDDTGYIDFLPRTPEKLYPDFSWGHFLNTTDKTFEFTVYKNRSKGSRYVRPMWEAIKWAQAYCREHSISTIDQWQQHCKENELPNDIPKNPERRYGKEFPGYPAWFGKKTTAIVDAHRNIKGVLALMHPIGEPVNVVSLRSFHGGISQLREGWAAQSEFDRVYATWELEPELMPQVNKIIAHLGKDRGGGIYIIADLNSLLWELNSILLIVR